MASMRFHPFGLFGLLSVLSTLSAAENLKMHTIRGLMTTCGDNVVLRCNVTTDGALDITEFSWKDSKDICNWGQPTNRTDMQCMTATSTNSYNYSLTIYNIQPKHTGAYHCQLHSKQGSRNGKTFVQVHKCVGKSTVRVNSTDGTCIFEDVFPRSGVSWKQGNDDSISHLATTTVTENEKGLFTVVSTMKVKKGSILLQCVYMFTLDAR
ncbi:hypothetical protein NL108_013880 [Boleophthalmus pectinirostris]|uniref:uncharacterized protein LOC110160598 n=1 Tax=Boleophthalmus pectinirostris TaxID=150288 RepID=UPI00242E873C|nr:uncharacterized protein LOC110160598 [Boleophthalmus pectinirostris]KAJ0058396.1 hypothetical protein NL108_013880 [Boleophthalmus pectinirostris]